jgi:hypothetical protein
MRFPQPSATGPQFVPACVHVLGVQFEGGAASSIVASPPKLTFVVAS